MAWVLSWFRTVLWVDNCVSAAASEGAGCGMFERDEAYTGVLTVPPKDQEIPYSGSLRNVGEGKLLRFNVLSSCWRTPAFTEKQRSKS